MRSIKKCLQEIKEKFSQSKESDAQTKKIVNSYDKHGWNSLHWSAYYERSVIIKELFKEGADVNKQTKNGWTPLQLAVKKSRINSNQIF